MPRRQLNPSQHAKAKDPKDLHGFHGFHGHKNPPKKTPPGGDLLKQHGVSVCVCVFASYSVKIKQFSSNLVQDVGFFLKPGGISKVTHTYQGILDNPQTEASFMAPCQTSAS